ncbi:MAG TPA: hypothetical protein VF014_10745 [Casimicrobiaceae bacterium]|nr:hypothetical protein [Casimicrobiaceae bacterium]
MRNTVFAALSVLIGIAIALALAEIACRILPVNDGLMAMPVNASEPVFHFTPNRRVTWSRDWNFSIVNRIRINNAGYVNDQDYDATDPRPLVAVVGDSYVEASMVPPRDTLHSRLAAAFAPAVRVYSFAASGAPLSQYLVWAREARERWKADALVIVVVGNDFDESLAAYKEGPGFHHYVAGAASALRLQRFDYAYGKARVLARSSAFVRYLVFNLEAQVKLRALASRSAALIPSARAELFVGNTAAAADSERLSRSKAAVLAFFRDLAAYAGWPPGSVLFIVDGLRYPTNDAAVAASFFVQMREFFIAEAGRAGYEAIDMDPLLFAHFRATGERFDYPTDGHWNGLAHRFAAEAARGSNTLSRWQPSGARAPR